MFIAELYFLSCCPLWCLENSPSSIYTTMCPHRFIDACCEPMGVTGSPEVHQPLYTVLFLSIALLTISICWGTLIKHYVCKEIKV
jgi:hypothetical protein